RAAESMTLVHTAVPAAGRPVAGGSLPIAPGHADKNLHTLLSSSAGSRGIVTIASLLSALTFGLRCRRFEGLTRPRKVPRARRAPSSWPERAEPGAHDSAPGILHCMRLAAARGRAVTCQMDEDPGASRPTGQSRWSHSPIL